MTAPIIYSRQSTQPVEKIAAIYQGYEYGAALSEGELLCRLEVSAGGFLALSDPDLGASGKSNFDPTGPLTIADYCVGTYYSDPWQTPSILTLDAPHLMQPGQASRFGTAEGLVDSDR